MYIMHQWRRDQKKMRIYMNRGFAGGAGSFKRHKQISAHDAFKWETLDNLVVQAEMGW
jgi:hypothetical protein